MISFNVSYKVKVTTDKYLCYYLVHRSSQYYFHRCTVKLKKKTNTRMVILECYCVARERPSGIRRIIPALLFIGKGTPFCCVSVIQVKYIKGMVKI